MFSAILRFLVCLGPLAMLNSVESQVLPPESVPSAVEQCIAGGFKGLCQYFETDPYENPTMCMFLICAQEAFDGYMEASIYRPADEGTACGHAKICQNEQCIEWEENDMGHRKYASSYYRCFPRNHTRLQSH